MKILEVLIETLPETLSFGLGASLAGAGRLTGAHWIPAVPPTMDLIGGFPSGARGITNYLAYGIGVALPYTDLIISSLKNYL